jgi:CDGSH-type Zn-finger protein
MRIKISKDGPYKVDADLPLEREEIQEDKRGDSCCWKKTGKVETKGEYHLCRCGNSKEKPFCDGNHVATNFTAEDAGEEEKYERGCESYAGKNLILCDKSKLCASARFCDRAGTAWNLVGKNDAKSEEILKQEVRDCPSGRLVLKDRETGKILEEKYAASVSLTEDKPAGVSGPIWAKGEIEIESPNGKLYEKRNRVTLCRCGKSKNKPFCDGSHLEGFKEN